MPLLIDLGNLPDACCSDALDELAKAQSFGTVEHLFDRMPNRWAADHVEAVSARLGAILSRMEEVLRRFLSGHTEELRKADVPWVRMDPARFEQTRNRLESMNPATMGLEDYMLLVEWLIARYLPDNVIETEAQYLAVRAALLGKIELNLALDRRVTPQLIEHIVELLPTRFAHVSERVLTPVENAMLRYGQQHAAEAIRHISEQVRHRFATLILEHTQAGILGQREGTGRHLQTRLFDELASTQRDMRRIAVTETGEIINQGYIAALQPGRQVKRVEAYRNTCSWCKEINGNVYNVVSPNDPNRNGDTDIWVGKTQAGRSASPMKREGDRLVERSPNERWWISAGLQHPNCRGSWVPVIEKPAEVSEEFFRFLGSVLDAASRHAHL